MEMLQIMLIVLFIQTFVVGFLLGALFTHLKSKRATTVSNNVERVDNPVYNSTPPAPVEKPAPRSVISKFPNPENVRKEKDRQQVQEYFKDLKSNPREGGTFVLADLIGKNEK